MAGKFSSRLYLAILVLLVAVAGGVYWYVDYMLSPVRPGADSSVEVDIPRGAHSHEVSSILKDKELIKNERVFIYYLKLSGAGAELRAGRHLLSPSQGIPGIVDKLTSGGREETVVFTVPEGYTLKQIGELLQQKDLVDLNEFNRLLARGDFSSYSFLEGIPKGSRRLEGYLFPDTYRVGVSSSEREIICTMLERFQEVMKELKIPARAKEKGLTVHEVVTIASMVEGEALVDRERPIIAGVILNRLDKGKLLQIDATVQYALGEHHAKLYNRHLQVDSPYNTYQNTGLPPGPIGTPGKGSLRAVLEAEDTDYLYYVAKPDGTHAFSETLQQHNINVSKYQ